MLSRNALLLALAVIAEELDTSHHRTEPGMNSLQPLTGWFICELEADANEEEAPPPHLLRSYDDFNDQAPLPLAFIYEADIEIATVWANFLTPTNLVLSKSTKSPNKPLESRPGSGTNRFVSENVPTRPADFAHYCPRLYRLALGSRVRT